jgi:tRNA uridine 5-carbamoylmethylation protein Kti12
MGSNSSMKKLIILRGLSGSGKSTKARELLREAVDEGLEVTICSADNYFIGPDDIYRFDPFNIGKAHLKCKEEVGASMEFEDDLIILDNTNTQKWEYEPYLNLASIYDYEVEIQMIGNLTDTEMYWKRNTHNVPRNVIERMAQRFES